MSYFIEQFMYQHKAQYNFR